MTAANQKPRNGELRVYHIPQVPMEAFYVHVNSVVEAKKILIVLADYDLFQLERNIKPDYSNAAGLEIFENNEWVDWISENGENIDEVELGNLS